MLAWTIYSSFLGMLVLMLLPPGRPALARKVALISSIAGLIAALGGAFEHGHGGEIKTIIKLHWLPVLGSDYYLAADGISVVLVLLTSVACLCGILFSWNIEHRAKEFFALYLALIAGVYGVFLSFDLLVFFMFYELAIIPKYFLIAIWGSTRREYGAMKLALYSFVGSAMVLIGIFAVYTLAASHTGVRTFDLIALGKVALPASVQFWAFPMVFIGFAILAGMWPFHTWAPTGHVAAPTAASMLLAGVVMKLGAYGALRVAMGLFPLGVKAWQNEVAILATIGIVYGAMVALVQKDFKFVIGYSSVSHMGFVLLGMVTLNEIGVSGAVLQMVSHGVIAGLLFGVVGRMIYDRTHTRDLDELSGMNLSRVLPFAAVTFVLAAAASMGLPGFSGFVAEMSVLIGAWHAFPPAALAAGVGIVIGVAYLLRALQLAFFSDGVSAARPESSSSEGRGDAPAHEHGNGNGHGHGHGHGDLPPITVQERVGAAILLAVSLAIGLYPRLMLDWIVPSVVPFLDALRKGSAG